MGKLFTESKKNFKLSKGDKYGYVTLGLFLSSYNHNSSGVNICPMASEGCKALCLVGSGNGGRFVKVNEGRKVKTDFFLSDRIGFLTQLEKELSLAVKRFKDTDTKLVVRLNGTSDISWEKFRVFDGLNIFEKFADVQFYDYTKNYLRFDKTLPANYDLTFSRSESNENHVEKLLAQGVNVAVVFADKLPATYKGYDVINGDESDLRFLDRKGVVVGLKYKKIIAKGADNTKLKESDFVVKTN